MCSFTEKLPDDPQVENCYNFGQARVQTVCKLGYGRFLPATSTKRDSVVLQACEIMKKRGHGKEAAQQLVQQLLAYKEGRAPYDKRCDEEKFDLKVIQSQATERI